MNLSTEHTPPFFWSRGTRSRVPGILTNRPHIAVRASIHAAPTLYRRCWVARSAARFFKIDCVPIRAVCNAVEELVVLCGAHGVDCNIEMPCMTHVVRLDLWLVYVWYDRERSTYFRCRALAAVATAAEAIRSGAFVNDLENQGV
jgi:hypothetical protein